MERNLLNETYSVNMLILEMRHEHIQFTASPNKSSHENNTSRTMCYTISLLSIFTRYSIILSFPVFQEFFMLPVAGNSCEKGFDQGLLLSSSLFFCYMFMSMILEVTLAVRMISCDEPSAFRPSLENVPSIQILLILFFEIDIDD